MAMPKIVTSKGERPVLTTVSLSHVPLAPLFPSCGASGRAEHHGEAKLLTTCGGKAARQGGVNPFLRLVTRDLLISPTFQSSRHFPEVPPPGHPAFNTRTFGNIWLHHNRLHSAKKLAQKWYLKLPLCSNMCGSAFVFPGVTQALSPVPSPSHSWDEVFFLMPADSPCHSEHAHCGSSVG